MTRKTARWDSMNKDNTPLEKLVLQYEAFNRSEGKTAKTVAWYRTTLGQFLDYVQSQNIEPILGSINVGVVREYILHLQGRTRYDDHPFTPKQNNALSPVTIQNYVRAIQAFFNWLYNEGYTEEYRLARLRQPKAPKKLKEPLTDAEIAALLSSIDTQVSWGSRNSTMVLLMLDTGLRLSELLTLEMGNLHLEEMYLKVMGKGQKERIVPFGSSAQKALMKYIYYFRLEPLRDDRVFLNLDGGPMTESGIKLLFQRLAVSSGVKRFHAHLLRHTFAINFLINGGDVFSLQQILGHSTLEMVRNYVNLAQSHIMVQHKRFSPLDRMNLRQVDRAVTMRKTGKGKRAAAFVSR